MTFRLFGFTISIRRQYYKRVSCKTCGKRFWDRRGLAGHIRFSHKTNKILA